MNFGMTETDVRVVLGDPDSEEPGFFFYHECYCQITFDVVEGKVSAIEFTWSGPQCDVRYRGVSVFYTRAEELVHMITGEWPTAEASEFQSDELDLGLWRPVVPSMYSPDDPDDEYRKGVYWQTIEIGASARPVGGVS